MLYVPVLGAPSPLTRYLPLESVVVLLMVIGEVALNDIVMVSRYTPVDVSFNFPDTLYVPPLATDCGDTVRVREVWCGTVL